MTPQDNGRSAVAGPGGQQTLNSVDVVESQPEHRPQIFALCRRHFGAWAMERLAKRWEWQCGTGNPWRSVRPTAGLVATDEGAVVGGVLLYPVPWRIAGKREIVLCGGELAIDQAYRTRVFPKLINGWMSRRPALATGLHPSIRTIGVRWGAVEIPMSQARFTLSLRNREWVCRTLRRRLPPALRHFIAPATTGRLLALKPLEAVLRRLARKGAPAPGRSLPGTVPPADLRPIERFASDYDQLWHEVSHTFRVTLDKDAAYLNWRYFDCPTFRHPIARGLYRDGKLSGIVVAGVYTVLDEDGEPFGANGEILELFSARASALEVEALVLSACRELNRKGVDKISILTTHAATQEILRRIGFQPDADHGFDYMVVFDHEDSKKGGRVESTEGVYITAGDGDKLNAFLM